MEAKELLFKDLSARLPYGVKAQYYGSEEEMLTVDTIEAIYEQPTDKIEPKFKVGDWITDGYVGGLITSIEDNYPCYKIADFMGGINTSIPFTLQDNYHLWTIEDAKDGDVLASGQVVFIFKVIRDAWLYCHCSVHNDGSLIAESYDMMTYKYFGEVHPATKEQRDLLFSKMKQEDYEWDAVKKELKKIEPMRPTRR